MARPKKTRTPANTPDTGELANAVLQSAASNAPSGQVEVLHSIPSGSGRATIEHNFVPASGLAGHMSKLHAQGVSVAHVVDEGGHLNGGQGVVHVPMVPVGQQGSNQWALPGQKAVATKNQSRYDKEVAATAKAGGLTMAPGVLHRNGVPLSPRTSTSDRPAFGMATGTEMISHRAGESKQRVAKAQAGVDKVLGSVPDAAHKFRRRMETVGDPYFGKESAARRAEEFPGAENPMAMEGPLRGPEQKVEQLRGEHEELMAKHPEYAKAIREASTSFAVADEALRTAQQGERTTAGKIATQQFKSDPVPTSAPGTAGIGTTSVPARFEMGSSQAASPSPSAAARAGRATPQYDITDPGVHADINHLHGVAHLANALQSTAAVGHGGAAHTALVNHMGQSESLRNLVQSIGSLPASESLPHYLARNIGLPSAEKPNLSLGQVAHEARQLAENHRNAATNQETYSLSDQFQALKGDRGKVSRGSWVAGSAPEAGVLDDHAMASQVIQGAVAARGQLPKMEPPVSSRATGLEPGLVATPLRALRGGEDRPHALGDATPTAPPSRIDRNELPYGTRINEKGQLEANPEAHGPWQASILDRLQSATGQTSVRGNVVSRAHAEPVMPVGYVEGSNPRAASGEAYDAMGGSLVGAVLGGHSEGKPNPEDVGDHTELYELGERLKRHEQAGDVYDTHDDYLADVKKYAAMSTSLIGGTSRELGPGELERSNVQPPSSARWSRPRTSPKHEPRDVGPVKVAPRGGGGAPATQLGEQGVQANKTKGEMARGQGAAKYAENRWGERGSVTGLAPEAPGTLNPLDFRPLPYYKPKEG